MIKINTIYIIDDDAITIFGIKKILKRTVTCPAIFEFENGLQALKNIVEDYTNNGNAPDVIFLDLNMPIMDGWQFLEELLKISFKKRLIINIVTSSIDPADEDTWKSYKTKTKHQLNFKIKPIFSIDFNELITVEKKY